VLIVSFLLAASCLSKIETKSLLFDSSQDVYTHEHSGFSFPPAIGRFERDKDIKFYDETGNNFSVPYNVVTSQEKVVGTVYIYSSLREYSITPVPLKVGQTPDWFLNQQYDGAKKAITESYRARLTSESEYNMNRSLLNAKGKKAIFEYDTVGGETVFSHLYLFAHKGWLVKYRFSYASKCDHVVKPEIERFLDLFKWP
jgi:hypothetical protein